MLSIIGATGQEPLHEDAVFIQVLNREGMVRAWPFEQLLKVVRGTRGGLLTNLAVGSATSEPSHRRLFFFLL